MRSSVAGQTKIKADCGTPSCLAFPGRAHPLQFNEYCFPSESNTVFRLVLFGGPR